ncbi:MAG: TetR/AcrR family transcriptional regulator [Chloroflexi bacterium]|nr:TetR/AcrR family transcriptional regulator [Chloroflexota bacterium]
MTVGRPREFDKENALKNAMLVFWRNGYSSASMADLTDAMGINKPSLYTAFGNKEQLFVSALEQYASQHTSPLFAHLTVPDQPLDQRLDVYLRSAAEMFCHPDLPAGCMLANSTCEFAGEEMPDTGHRFISNLNQAAEQSLIDFFTQEQAKGNLTSERSPHTLTLYLMTITSGMAVLARNGAPLAQLNEMIEHVVTTIAYS